MLIVAHWGHRYGERCTSLLLTKEVSVDISIHRYCPNDLADDKFFQIALRSPSEGGGGWQILQEVTFLLSGGNLILTIGTFIKVKNNIL